MTLSFDICWRLDGLGYPEILDDYKQECLDRGYTFEKGGPSTESCPLHASTLERRNQIILECSNSNWKINCRCNTFYHLTIPSGLIQKILSKYKLIRNLCNQRPIWLVEKDDKQLVVKLRHSKRGLDFELDFLENLKPTGLVPYVEEYFSYDENHHILVEEYIPGNMLDESNCELMDSWFEAARAHWKGADSFCDFNHENFILTNNGTVKCIDIEPNDIGLAFYIF